MAPLPPPEPHKANPRKGSKKNSHKSEARKKCTNGKSKQIALPMVKSNINEVVEPLFLIAHQDLDDEIPKESIPKVPLPIKMVF